MKKSRFTDAQIMAILKQGESGVPVSDLELNLRIKPKKRLVREKPREV